jgi:hypothetical protein
MTSTEMLEWTTAFLENHIEVESWLAKFFAYSNTPSYIKDTYRNMSITALRDIAIHLKQQLSNRHERHGSS